MYGSGIVASWVVLNRQVQGWFADIRGREQIFEGAFA